MQLFNTMFYLSTGDERLEYINMYMCKLSIHNALDEANEIRFYLNQLLTNIPHVRPEAQLHAQ